MPVPDPRLPVTVPSGFLGAGRAMLLDHVLNDGEGRCTALDGGLVGAEAASSDAQACRHLPDPVPASRWAA